MKIHTVGCDNCTRAFSIRFPVRQCVRNADVARFSDINSFGFVTVKGKSSTSSKFWHICAKLYLCMLLIMIADQFHMIISNGNIQAETSRYSS